MNAIKTRRAAFTALPLFFFFTLSPIVAQDAPGDDDFVPLSEMKPLEPTLGLKNRHSFRYGVTASNTVVNTEKRPIKDGGDVEHAPRLFLGNYRPFFSYMYNETHAVNVRGRVTYEYNPSLTTEQKDSSKPGGGAVVSNVKYSVELLNTELDFGQHKVTVGRSFYRMGRGLLLANFADGAEYTGAFRWLQVKAWGLYSGQYSGCTISIAGCGTNGDTALKGAFDIIPGRPIDAQVPDPGRRFFVGTEIQSASLLGSNLYLMALYSRDMSREKSTAANNSDKLFAFDPYYLGAGAQGFIGTPRIRYLVEGIMQQGNTIRKNQTGITNEQISINAWAVTADLTFSFAILQMFKPAFTVQYAYATGRDSDKPNPNNPAQEAEGRVDNNFYAFGVYSAGLALQPRLSNLHVARLGLQFRPLYEFYWGRNLMLSVKYSLYEKGNANYGIFDGDATEKVRPIGSGLDIQTVWDIRSDLKFFYAYGYFAPGTAYLEDRAKSIHSHIISLNLLF